MKAYKELLFLSKLNGVGPARINKFYMNYLKRNMDITALQSIARENEKKVDEQNIAAATAYAESTYLMMVGRKDITILTVLDEEYPAKLRDLENKTPVILYVKGDISILNNKSIAIIGTREPSEWSVKVEPRLVAKILESSDYVITSGLALGCDTIGHSACVEKGGKTIAMLPCGFDKISPVENVGLSEKIIKKGGALISEYLPEEEATKYTFVERDTLIAAISDAILVIECGMNSGTMHAVENGVKLNRRIATYITALNDKGNYEGNKYIVSEKLGIGIKDTEDLQFFLKTVEEGGSEQTPTQISLFDLIGG